LVIVLTINLPVNMVANLAINMAYMQHLTGASGQTTQNNAVLTAENSYLQIQQNYRSSLVESQGLQAQLALQRIADQVNVNTDLSLLGAKQSQLASTKSIEFYTMIAQQREKILNLQFDILNNKLSNTWNRIKTAAGAFKY